MRKNKRSKFKVAIMTVLLSSGIGIFRYVDSVSADAVASTVAGGEDGVAFSPDGSHVYFPNAPRSLIDLDLSTGSRRVISLSGSAVRDVAIDSTGLYAYVTQPDLRQITKVRLSDGAEIAQISAYYPSHIAIGKSGQYAYTDGVAWFYRIRLADNSISELPGLSSLTDIAIDPNEQFAYVSDWNANAVKKINLSTMQIDDQINNIGQVKNLIVDAQGKYAYVAVHSNSSVTKIDLTTFKAVESISVGINPWGVALSPNNKWLYVSNFGSNSVSKVNLTNSKVTSTIAVGKGPKGIEISPDGTTAAVVNSTDQTTSIISLSQKESQNITFAEIQNNWIGKGSISLTATASSGLGVSFASTNTEICTIDGSVLRLNKIGTCVVTATQVGADDWEAATPVVRTFSVVNQTIKLVLPATAQLENQSVDLAGTTNSTNPVIYASQTPDVCTVVGSKAQLKATGLCRVSAVLQGTAGDAAVEDVQSFMVLGEIGVSINDGSSYTKSKAVTIELVWPSSATAARISNDGGFKPSSTRSVPLASSIKWDLDDSVKGSYTKIVYVRFTGPGIDSTETYTDDIILDTISPILDSVAVSYLDPKAKTVVVSSAKIANGKSFKMTIKASDRISGIGTVEIKNRTTGKLTKLKYVRPKSTSQSFQIKSSTKIFLVRVLDRAGNTSGWKSLVVSR